MEQLTNKIKQAFSGVDAESLKKLPSLIREEREFLKDAINNKGETWRRCGTFYEEMAWGETNQITRAYNNLSKTHEARNERIAKKLIDKNVTDINLSSSDIIWGNNFETTWNVDNLSITLQVVWAGGYNIQCLHPRVLCNVRECK